MMKSYLIFAYGLLTLSALSLSFSCKKPTLTETDLVPAPNLTLSTDTLDVEGITIREDSLRTDDQPFYPAGNISGSVFGSSSASLYCQPNLPSNNVNLDGNLILDSLVLSLVYHDHYGDADIPQTFRVHRLQEKMDQEKYYSSDEFSVSSADIGSAINFIPDFENKISVYGQEMEPHLRIKLDNAVGVELLKALGMGTLENNADFIDLLQGLRISPDPAVSGKGLYYFDMNSADTRLTLFYHSSEEDSLTFDFEFNEDGPIFTHYSHDYSNSTVQQFIRNSSETEEFISNPKGDSILFLSSLAGLKSLIRVPAFDTLKDIAVQKAQLIFTTAGSPEVNEHFQNPEMLTCLRRTEEGRNATLADQIREATIGSYTFGGGKNMIEPEITDYRFNLSFYFQNLAKGAVSGSGLHLLTFPSSRIGDRVVISGNNGNLRKPKLIIVYSKTNQ